MNIRFDIRSLPYQPFLIAAFIGISIYAPNRHYFPVEAMILPMFILISLIGIALIVLKYAQLDINKGLIFISGTLLLNFTYYVVYDMLSWRWQVVSPATIIYTLLLILLIIVTWRATCSQAKEIAQILGVVTVSMVIIALANLALSINSDAKEISYLGDEFEAQFQRYLAEDLTSPLNKRDFYFIVIDGYRGEETTSTEFGVNNKEFIQNLTSMGFVVLNESKSNYGITDRSLPSMLNLDYYDAIKVAGYDEENNRLWRFFKSQGFTFVFLPSRWPTTVRNDYADIVLNPYPIHIDRKSKFTIFQRIMFFERTLLGKTYYSVIFQLFDENIPSISVAGMQERITEERKFEISKFRVDQRTYLNQHNDFHMMYTYDNLTKIAKIPGSKYVFAHIDEKTCTKNELLDQNRRIESAICNIIANSPNKPVIVLLSDHGSRPPAKAIEDNREIYKKYASYPAGHLDQDDIYASWYTLDNFAAFYLPDGGHESIYSDMTPVNAWRMILNYYFDTDFSHIEDKHYWKWRHGGILEII